MNKLATFFLLSCFLILTWSSIHAQNPQNRAVQVSAAVQNDPPRIDFSWPFDWSAGGYTIYKKDPQESSWGDPVGELPFGALGWSDTDVVPGVRYEYAFFKKQKEFLIDTISVAAGTDATFTIHNIFGHGICCNYGTGFYEIENCGTVVVEGGQFDFEEATTFNVCGDAGSDEEVIIRILPDLFAKNMYWTLIDENTNDTLAASPPAGTIDPENPKYGYILTGIEAPLIGDKGSVLLLVDEFYADELAAEIEALRLDYWLDGYRVFVEIINREEEVPVVKTKIQQVYDDAGDLTTVMLLGHVPVPYSGIIYPDGHIENHEGAWPADGYYADMDGVWTDETVSVTTAQFERNHNLPGDGKFDQSVFPSPLELQIGRVDLIDMPAFAESDLELLRRYLAKSHAFKTGQLDIKRRALIDDNLNVILGAPAASAWRNFSQFFTADSVKAADYFTEMQSETYLWSYGCGGGSHISAAGVGTTADFASDSLLTIFTSMLGSQFGDWDNPDNFLRAPLAQGLTLTNAWVGNPAYHFHHMALGYPIGYSLLRTQNATLEDYHPGPQLVHTSILGDPTLRLHPVKPPVNVTADSVGQTVEIHWSASDEEDIVSYQVYRADAIFGIPVLLHNGPILDTFFVDEIPVVGNSVYLVKTIKMETSGSGTYLNSSLAAYDEAFFDIVDSVDENEISDLKIYPNPASTQLFLEGIDAPLDVEIIDANGKLIQVHKAVWNEPISVEGMASGVYWLRLEKDGETFYRKWVKI